jgi:hypothetical protein
MSIDPQIILQRYFDIPFGDKLVSESKAALVTNKNLAHASNSFPNIVGYFSTGSNSTVNALRYHMLHNAVATAAGEPESNVAIALGFNILIKRIQYIVGSNTKNASFTMSLRKNYADIPETVGQFTGGENTRFDSGELNIPIDANDLLNWKWDTSGCSSGGVTIISWLTYEIKLGGSDTEITTTSRPTQLAGLSTAIKPTEGVADYTEFIETDTLEKYVIINGIWYSLGLVKPIVQPNTEFIANRVLTSGGLADFLHWVEPLIKHNKVVVPFSFLSNATSGGIGISDDGINFREVLRSVTADENFWLCARDRGDLCLVGSGSSVSSVVGSVYRSTDGGETWTNIFANQDIRVYGIDFSIPTNNAIIVTSAGGVPTTSGKILRSTNISVGSPTVAVVKSLTEGGRCVKTITKTKTILVGTGHATQAGIWKSTDEGATWTKKKTFTSAEATAIYWFEEWIDPNSGISKIFAFGVEGRIFLSNDDGETWTKVLESNASGAPIRRVVNYNGLLLCANYYGGIWVFDPKTYQITPIFSETRDYSASPFYCLVKYAGNLVGTISNRLLFSGKVSPTTFNLWSAKSITDTTNGDVTSPFSMVEHSPLSCACGIYSNQSGTLTVQIYDPVANVWRDHTSTVAITANTLKLLSFVESPMSARASFYWRIKFVPSVAATVNLWVSMN